MEYCFGISPILNLHPARSIYMIILTPSLRSIQAAPRNLLSLVQEKKISAGTGTCLL